MARTCGSISADAAPCATRAPTSDHASGASPQASEVSAEGGHAAQEQPAAPEGVAEPPAEDQQHGVRDGVAGDDHLQSGGAGVQVAVDGGQGDVDDEEVDHRQGRAEQQVNSPRG